LTCAIEHSPWRGRGGLQCHNAIPNQGYRACQPRYRNREEPLDLSGDVETVCEVLLAPEVSGCPALYGPYP